MALRNRIRNKTRGGSIDGLVDLASVVGSGGPLDMASSSTESPGQGLTIEVSRAGSEVLDDADGDGGGDGVTSPGSAASGRSDGGSSSGSSSSGSSSSGGGDADRDGDGGEEEELGAETRAGGEGGGGATKGKTEGKSKTKGKGAKIVRKISSAARRIRSRSQTGLEGIPAGKMGGGGKGRDRGSTGNDFDYLRGGSKSLTSQGKGQDPSSPLCSSPYRRLPTQWTVESPSANKRPQQQQQQQQQLASGESTANPSPPPPQQTQTQTRSLPPTGASRIVRGVTAPSATTAFRERETSVGSKSPGYGLAEAVAEGREGEGVPTRGRRLWGSVRVPDRGHGEDGKGRSVSPTRMLSRGGGGGRGSGGDRDGSRSASPRRMPWSPRKESATAGADSRQASLDSPPGDSSPLSTNLEAGLHPGSVGYGGGGGDGGGGGGSVHSGGSLNYDGESSSRASVNEGRSAVEASPKHERTPLFPLRTPPSPSVRKGMDAVRVRAAPGMCCSDPNKASTPTVQPLKYGDRLRLYARLPPSPKSDKMRSSGMSVGSALGALGSAPGAAAAEAALAEAGEGGYVGSMDSTPKVHRRMSRRSELAVIGQVGASMPGFMECHFKAVDPENKKRDGDVVRLGDAVFLTDDRNYVWRDNSQLSTGSLRMKPRGSKKEIAVSFDLFNSVALKVDSDGNRPAVTFGTQGLKISTMDYDNRDTRRRRVSSMHTKKHRSLTAFSTKWSKKSNGSSSISGAFLCADGRGEKIVFDVHPANAIPDCPNVDLVFIHSLMQQTSQSNMLSQDLEKLAKDAAEPSRRVSSRFPGQFEISAHLNAGSNRRGSITSVSSGGSGGGPSWGLSGNLSEMSASVWQSAALSPTTEARDGGKTGRVFGGPAYVGEEEEDLEEEEEEALDGGTGMIAGVNWGEYVEFVLPPEVESTRQDAALSLRLSNGYSASLTYAQLLANKGTGSFAVEARIDKEPGSGSSNASPKPSQGQRDSGGDGFGTVYLSCCVRTITAAGTGTPTSKLDTAGDKEGYLEDEPEGDIFSGLFQALSCVGRVVLLGNFRKQELKTLDDGDRCGSKVTVKNLLSYALCLIGAVVILSTSGLLKTASTLSAPPPTLTTAAGPRPSPFPCHSVWHLRRPDGTAYPHQRLAAAAAALDAPASAEEAATYHGLEEEGSLPSQGGGRKQGGDDAAATAGAVASVAYSVPLEEGAGFARGLAGAAGGEREGVGFWAMVVFGSAAAVVIVLKGLFGDSTPSREKRTPSPMQAQVCFLGWDSRRMTEPEAVTQDDQDVYYPPPSGSDLKPMPHRFLLAENKDVTKAWARWEATLRWRKENNTDDILSKPHPRYALIKSKYKHCFHLADKGGRLTYYERPGMSNFADMKKAGISRDDLLQHYVYCMEFLWQVLQPKQTQRITIIIDLAGVKFRDIVGESVIFLKTSVGMMSRHYPQRSFKIMILNAPSFFNSVFAMVKPLLNEATKKKIDLLPVAHAGDEMLKVIPSESLPPHYGGTSQVPLMESPAEVELLRHVQSVLEQNGQTMEKVP